MVGEGEQVESIPEEKGEQFKHNSRGGIGEDLFSLIIPAHQSAQFIP
jgi:hypothetical protein